MGVQLQPRAGASGPLRLFRGAGLLLLLVLLAGPSLADPFEPAVHFVHLGREDGLAHFTVEDVLQDRRGFVWLATRNGLDRFDGHGFRRFRRTSDDPASLGYDRLSALLEARDGTLWIGTDGGGVARLRPELGGFDTFLPAPDLGFGAPPNRVGALAEGPDGRIWLATLGGVHALDPGSGRFASYRPSEAAGDRAPVVSGDVFDVEVDREGTVWIASAAGLERFDPVAGRFDLQWGGGIRSLLPDPDGGFWLGTLERGVIHLDPDAEGGDRERVLIAGVRASALLLGEPGSLWVGGGTGLRRLDLASGEVERYGRDPLDPASLAYDTVNALHLDATGILWIATWGGGADRLDVRSTLVERARHRPGDPGSLGDSEVMSVLVDSRGTLWVGTWRGGLDRLDPGAEAFRAYRQGGPEGLRSNRVTALHEDRRGRLWVGVRGAGVHLLDREGDRFEVFPVARDPDARVHMVHALADDARGRLWMGTSGGGLVRMDPETGDVRVFVGRPGVEGALVDDDVWDLLAEDEGLWVGTSAGLYLMDWETERFAPYRFDRADPTSLPHDRVNSLLRDRSGRLWVATGGGGLARIVVEEGRRRFRRVGAADGLPSDQIQSLIEDARGRLWIGSDQGISRFDPDTGSVRTYRATAGVQEAGYFEGSVARDPEGRLLFGGLEGLTRFDPEDLGDAASPPRIVLSDFLVANRSVPVSRPGRSTPLERPIDLVEEIVLDDDRFPLTFEFAALQYADPDEHRFLYRLEGLDPDWIPADARNRRATYSRLPPGRYTFRVRGANADGVWSVDEASVVLVIRPPWWMTWWARGIGAALVLGLVLGIYRVRLHRLRLVQARLERRVEERTAELADANARLQAMIREDDLTGLPNRRGFLERAEREIVAARRSGRTFVLGLGDIDRFKQINDTWGHEAGDECLREIARRLREALRAGDLVGRWGGEEFVFLFPETDADGARVVAEKVRRAVAERPIEAVGPGVSVTLTVGLTVADPEEAIDRGLSRADGALYRGKEAGRDRIVLSG